MKTTQPSPMVMTAFGLVAFALWLRWPSFDFDLWNVDEAIHATAARTLLDGGVLYRDAIDQRTPLSYYAVAGIFALFGENNLWAVRCLVAGLIGATSCFLLVAGRRLHHPRSGLMAGLFFTILATTAFHQGDANAVNTEWFVAFFTSAAAAVFLSSSAPPTTLRLGLVGMLFGCAFLSKQPALLDAAAPLGALGYLSWQQGGSWKRLLRLLGGYVTGWFIPVAGVAFYMLLNGAWGDAVFYSWTYNLHYYAPELSATDRINALIQPFALIGDAQPWLLGLWLIGAWIAFQRLAQRQPTSNERATNHGLVFLAIWSCAALAGTASSGRDFGHYTIQFLAPYSLGAGISLGVAVQWLWSGGKMPKLARLTVIVLGGLVSYQAVTSVLTCRNRSLPEDASRRISAYINEHSSTTDRIFVWGYHPDIYVYSNRKSASRFLYASFLTGLIPWTNTAPDRNTEYAIVPGAMADLLSDLHKSPPQFIVDCSAGPNRHWNKYPPDNFPRFNTYLHEHYRQVAAEQFVPQGFRLYARRAPGDAAAEASGFIPYTESAELKIGVSCTPIEPVGAEAPFGAKVFMEDGRRQYFVHAPSRIVYDIPKGASTLQGGFMIGAGAYASGNSNPTDGAEFVIRWQAGGKSQVLFRRLLQPTTNPQDRERQSFRVKLPPHQGGKLELITTPGPADNSASDWTFWSDLMLENYR
jgi:4-amino-4-deoxy-L-arabinose transferase-like glycosyltransferase